MRLSKHLILILIVLSFANISYANNKLIKARIVRIVDGDTTDIIVLNNTSNHRIIRLRLIGIDTPEKYHSHKLTKDSEKCNISRERMSHLGYLSTRRARRYLHRKHIVYVTIYGIGYYYRKLAIVYYIKNNKLIDYNNRIVRDGYACLYKYRSKALSKKEHYKLQQSLLYAKKHRRGLWRYHYQTMNCLCGNPCKSKNK